MIDLGGLLIFAKIVETNSFAEAGRRLGMPTSTVSRRLAALEHELGVQLLDRTTRTLRLTDAGAQIFEQARVTSDLADVVENIASNHLSTVTGTLRLSAPTSISDSVLFPLVRAFQDEYPDVRVQILVTERFVDLVADGVDLALNVGWLADDRYAGCSVRHVLSYRHQLVASRSYLAAHRMPQRPEDLLDHRLLAFSFWKPLMTWAFTHATSGESRSLSFRPYVSMNDYAGLAPGLAGGLGIGDLPPIVQPWLVRAGDLIEVMPEWRMRRMDLTLVHLAARYVARPIRAFDEFAADFLPKLFPTLTARR